MIKKLTTKIVYENKWMKVREDGVEFPQGSTGIFGVVDKADFALIVPFEKNGFHLVKQYRYPVAGSFWEFPQGSYESDVSISSIDLAKKELEEETGLLTKKIEEIGFLYEAYGFSNQGFHIFLASDFKKSKQKLEASEIGMETNFFTIDEFERMILSGEIKDAPTISAYGLMKAKKII